MPVPFPHRYTFGASLLRASTTMALAMTTTFAATTVASAQTGVDDDRVSLPDGPGSLEGVGDNVELDPNMGSMSWSVPTMACFMAR